MRLIKLKISKWLGILIGRINKARAEMCKSFATPQAKKFPEFYTMMKKNKENNFQHKGSQYLKITNSPSSGFYTKVK